MPPFEHAEERSFDGPVAGIVVAQLAPTTVQPSLSDDVILDEGMAWWLRALQANPTLSLEPLPPLRDQVPCGHVTPQLAPS